MGLALHARFRSRDGVLQGEQTIHRLPARFGRNAVNDCVLAHPYVSTFHAEVDLVDGQLCIKDLNSRNGLYSSDLERLPPQRAIPLKQLGNAFVVGRAIEVMITTFDDRRDVGARSSVVEGSILGNRNALAGGAAWSQALEGSSGIPSLPPLSIADAGVPPPHVSMPHVPPARSGYSHDQSLPPLAPLDASLARSPVASYAARPPSAYPPAGPRAAAPAPGGVGPRTQHLTMSVELMALLGLRELAASLVPEARIETTGDIARLVTKLHDLVEVFCRIFVPLRESVGPAPSHRAGSRSALSLEGAHTPPALAAALLDWRNNDYDAAGAVEQMLSDVVLRVSTMQEESARRIEEILAELSPDAIEQSVRDDAGLGAVFGRHRALWQELRQRHEKLTRELSPGAGARGSGSFRSG